jgi:hypothetical protein
MSQAGIKAGIIGGAIGVVLALLQIVPWCGLLACCAFPVLWLGIGAWAVRMGGEKIETVGQGAGAGGIAGGLGGVISAMASGALTMLAYILGRRWGPAYMNFRFTLDQLETLRRWGIEIRPFGEDLGYWLAGSVCVCAMGIVIAAILGAVGGLIYKAMKSQKGSTQTSS